MLTLAWPFEMKVKYHIEFNRLQEDVYRTRLTQDECDLVESYYRKAQLLLPHCPKTKLWFYDNSRWDFGYCDTAGNQVEIGVNRCGITAGSKVSPYFSAVVVMHELGHACLGTDPRFNIRGYQKEYDKREGFYLEVESACDGFAHDMVVDHFSDHQPLLDALKMYLTDRARIFLPGTKPCDRP